MSIQWLSGFNTAPAKSACGSYVIRLLVSPDGHYGAYFRASLYDLAPCGKPVKTLDEAKQQAQTHANRANSSEAANG